MSYYYITKDGTFTDSSAPIDDPKYIRINELEYAVTRLIVMGYSQNEIENAIVKVFDILERDY